MPRDLTAQDSVPVDTNDTPRSRCIRLVRLGYDYLARAKYLQAEIAFQKAFECFPENPQALIGQAETMWALNRLDEVVSICRQVLAISPDDLRTLLMLALGYFKIGDWERSAHYYQRILRIDRNIPEAWFGLGQIALVNRDSNKAMEHFRRMVAIKPVTAATMCLLSRTGLDGFPEAGKFLDFWKNIVGRYVRETLASGRGAQDLIEYFKKFLVKEPTNALLMYLLASIVIFDPHADSHEGRLLLEQCATLLPRWSAIFSLLAHTEHSAHLAGESGDSDVNVMKAELHLRHAISLEPYNPDIYEQLWVTLFCQGRTMEAHDELVRFEKRKQALQELAPGDDPGVRYILSSASAPVLGQGGIPSGTAGIGLIGLLDYYVKSQELGIIPKKEAIILAPVEKIVNPCYLDYWQQFVTIIKDQTQIEQMMPMEPSLRYRIDGVAPLPDGRWGPWWQAMAAVEHEWERLGRGSLLKLKDEHREQGYDRLAALGVHPGDWFVCLHVRDNGDAATPNNCDIESYRLAVEEIISRGGVVFRMGDPGMPPLSIDSDRFFDYAHMDWRSDFMDVFLVAQCKFFVGTASGLCMVAHSFGIPSAMTNFTPQAARPFSSRDIFTPKLTRRISDGTFLGFREAGEEPLGLNFMGAVYRQHGVEFVNNTPEEILELVKEMFDRLNGTFQYNSKDRELQERYNAITRNIRGSFGENSPIGKSFIERHEDLLRA